MQEGRWSNIPGFPNYMISDDGKVWNHRTESYMSVSKTLQGDHKVTLTNDEERVTRSVRVLVAEAFVERPYEDGGAGDGFHCDTVIVLDNDKNNISSYNLAWRPNWFAQRYARQFKSVYPAPYYSEKILNTASKRLYSSILECGMSEGLLFDDIWRSAITGDSIFPTGVYYAFQ